MAERYSALILAGGLSSRMHFPKAYLLYRDSSFAEKIIREYREAGIESINIVMNHQLCKKEWEGYLSPIREKATIIENHKPEIGRSYSLLLGLNNAMQSDYCFIQNVDNPFVDSNLISRMIRDKNEGGLTVPAYLGKTGHPAMISKKIMRDILRNNQNDFNLKEMLKRYPRNVVEVDTDEILLNINTHEDYFNYIKLQMA